MFVICQAAVHCCRLPAKVHALVGHTFRYNGYQQKEETFPPKGKEQSCDVLIG